MENVASVSNAFEADIAGTISKSESRQRLKDGGARSLQQYRRNVHRVSVFVRYVFGESLLRLAVDTPLSPQDAVREVNFIDPSAWQVDNNCNLCKGKHRRTNRACGASNGRLRIPRSRVYDLKSRKPLPGRYAIINVAQRARQKHGTATLIKL